VAVNQPQDNWADAIESVQVRNRVLRLVDDLFAALPANWVGRSLMQGDGIRIKVQDTDSGRVCIVDFPLSTSATSSDLNTAIRSFLASQSKERDYYTVS